MNLFSVPLVHIHHPLKTIKINLVRYQKVRVFILIIILGQFTCVNAQSKKTISIGFGFNSTINYQPIFKEVYVPEAIPLIMISPGLHFKINSSEFFIGTDFFPWAHFYSPQFNWEMCGGEAEYKYHFIKRKKRHDFFISSYLQYCQIRTGGLEPLPYNDKSPLAVCPEYGAYKIKSITNMYGVGFQYTFLKRIRAYTTINAGYSLNEVKAVDYDWSEIFLKNRLNFMSSFRCGISFDIFKKNNS